MFCTQCGNEITKQTIFCTNCGFRFDYETKPKVKMENKPKSKGRLDLKSIKFFENPILNFVILIIMFVFGIPILPIIVPILAIYFIFKKIIPKNK